DVTNVKVADSADAVRAKKLIKRSLKSLLVTKDKASIFATEEDLKALMAFTGRGVKDLAGHVKIIPGRLTTSFTLELPDNPVGHYVNIHLSIESSRSGIKISRTALGRIPIPGDFVLTFLRYLIDFIMGDEQGTLFMESVESVIIDKNTITVHFSPVPQFKQRLRKMAARLKYLRDEIALLGDPLTVRLYYAKLIELSERDLKKSSSVSLTHFIGPLFYLAKRRSKDNDPADENQAAILALAMYLGHWRFGSLVGPVLTDEMKRHRRPRDVVLGGRRDLRLHFIYSAGIKIFSDRGITYAIGEFKELLDAARGGTGFSFADLAADLAGVRFAEVATDGSSGARRLQSLLAGNVREEVFFPDVTDLPENIPQAEFERRYGNVESDEYRAILNRIERAISKLPAYRTSRGTVHFQ
ncbi:MAG: hypothetical protein SV375_10715, partial [Thermodesulfobacteriota bacterium]|nr:hypothetical protein [Thermodesulfobacteriota bacterium]